MNVVIIEDEHLTAERIRTLLERIEPGIAVMAVLDSVKEAVSWFRQNRKPDLVLMDIQLADGICFQIFDQVEIEIPVVFITAYQEYAIRAFKVNSVDYLLKPVTEEALVSAIEKYRHHFGRPEPAPIIDRQLLGTLRQMMERSHKTRFMVRVGEQIRSIGVERILYVYSLQKSTYLHTDDHRNYPVDYTLEALSGLLDPDAFFRINRSHIITHRSIRRIITLSATRLKVELEDAPGEELFVSRERQTRFKEWLDR